jgi:hypothetical protein
VNTVTSRGVEAADELALARLDDDGAPLAVTWSQVSHSQDHHTIRRGRTAKAASSQAQASNMSRPTANPPLGQAPAAEAVATMIPPGSARTTRIPAAGAADVPAAIPAGPPSPRVSLNGAHDRRGAADGRWWPHSRSALTELPGLIAALDSQPGIRVQRLSIHRDDWDEIPYRLTDGRGHVVRVDWFTTIPRHTVSVTTAGREPITLLVIPPGTAEGAARTAMNMAATGPVHRPGADS